MMRFLRERRQSRRDGLDLPVQFRIYLPSCPETASSFLPGQINDFSQDGLALLTNAIQSDRFHIFHPTPTTSEQCLLEIRIPNHGEDLTLRGKVIWYDRNAEEAPFMFRVGIQILDHTKDLRRQIEASIREHESTADPLM
jgi:Tfp pilus assembly protein PilZ